MRFVNLKFILPFVLFLVSAAGGVCAEEAPWMEKFLKEFEEIQARLTLVEENQQKILENQTKILEGQHQLRIWVRRS